MGDAEIIDIWINCPEEAVAEKIAEHLHAEGLVAASNIYPAVRSAYRWKGRLDERTEVPLRVRTSTTLFQRVSDEVRQLHPDETPSVVATEICATNDDYRDWVIAATEASERARS